MTTNDWICVAGLAFLASIPLSAGAAYLWRRWWATTFRTAAMLDYSNVYQRQLKCLLQVNSWDRRRYMLVHDRSQTDKECARNARYFAASTEYLMLVQPWCQRSLNYKDLQDLDAKRLTMTLITEFGLPAKKKQDFAK